MTVTATNVYGAAVHSITVLVAKAPSVTSVVSSLPTSTLGNAVRFTASTSGRSGTVVFAVDGAPLGSPVPVVGGTATSAYVSSLRAGAYTVTAAYSGDADSLGNPASLVQLVRYGVRVLWPTPNTSVRSGSDILVAFQLTDAAGRPIPDSEAAGLVGGTCRVTVSASGAQTQPRTCAADVGLLDVFAAAWRTAPKRPGVLTVSVSITYPGAPTQTVAVTLLVT